jgi:CDP-4-dehydro-6-deoxyglucose reductase, E1
MTGSRERERVLEAEILERARELARLRREGEREFVPGKTPIRYAGRVWDEAEMVNLVESSLEFWLTAGRWHRKLERDLATWYGMPHARLVNSGSSANLLAAAALMSPVWKDRRLRPGDEVLTVAAGFPTTVAPIIQLGAIPVFVDISIPTYNVDVSLLEEALSPRTRALVLAHTLGNPFDLDAVTVFCEKNGLWLVEDNCDASGSLYRGRKTGTFGDLATLSFYPPHHMTTGEGGAVLCRSGEMNRVVESLRDWGRDCWCAPGIDNTCGKRFGWKLGDLPEAYDHKYVYSHLGFNLKMTDMQAAVGCAQLEKLDSFGAARRENWRYFREVLADLGEFFVLPEPTEGADPSWFGFLMTVREDAPFSRGDVVRHLESKRIQTRMLFAGNLTRQPALAGAGLEGRYRVVGELSQTDVVMNRSFWIGVYPGLTEAQRHFVASTLKGFVATSQDRGS